MKRAYIFAFTLVAFTYLPVSATIINIRDDYPTIQQGINASTDGDTVLVEPGAYVENITIIGRNIVLGSWFLTTGNEWYIGHTTIEGNRDTVLVIANCGNGNPMIIGFTITQGSIGIQCQNCNPIIAHNKIVDIHDWGAFVDVFSAGIICESSHAIIAFNWILNTNARTMGFDSEAEAYGVRGINSDLTLINNVISSTVATASTTASAFGYFCVGSNPTLRNNTIVYNGADYGGGIWSIDSNPILLNDIIWYNSPGVIFGYATASYCNMSYDWDGEGNIHVEPLFRDFYRLMSTTCGDSLDSPCIDAGNPDILDTLLDCSWGLGELRSDMGAYGGGEWVMVGVDEPEIEIPGRFALSQNYPNPFNAMTVIRYGLPEPSDVIINIYDILGRRVETLVQGEQPAGYHQIAWDASDQSSGIHFYRIQAGEYSDTKKMVLLK